MERVSDGRDLVLRLGLRLVKGLRDDAIETLIAAYQEKAFKTLPDFKRRTRLMSAQLDALIAADALNGLSGHRHQSHWEAARGY